VTSPSSERGDGDPDVVRRRAGDLRDAAVEVRVRADELVSRTDALPWSGRAAGAMRSRVTERASRMREAAAGFEVAGEALAAHAAAVDAARETITHRQRRARTLVEDAQERLARVAPGSDPEPADVALAAADLPPAGHRAWLTFELPAP